ncbi:MAG: hypothetical protein ACKO5W_04615 [Crocinitomicaceae bacterium]
MKNNILFIGAILILLNTLLGLIVTSYPNFNMIFADISILLSTGILYFLFQSSAADGFKIGVGFIGVLSGIGRFLCAVFSSVQLENNLGLIIFLFLITLEVITIFVAQKLSSK